MNSERICGISKSHFRSLMRAERSKQHKIKMNLLKQLEPNHTEMPESITKIEPTNQIITRIVQPGQYSSEDESILLDEFSIQEVSEEENFESENSLKKINRIVSEVLKQNEGLIERVKELERKQADSEIIIDKLERDQAKSKLIIKTLEKKIFPSDSVYASKDAQFFNLPIDTDIAIEDLNDVLQDENINKKFKTCIQSILGYEPPQNLPSLFSKIFTDKALFQFNLKGAKSKKSFISLKRVYNGIYDAIKNENFKLLNYEVSMQQIFRLSHCRIRAAKQQIRKKKMQKNNAMRNLF